MAVRRSTGQANAQLNAEFNGGAGVSFDSGVLEFRTGSQPASADDAPTGTVVASVTLPADAFGTAAAKAVAKAGTWQDPSADATGVIGWARMRTTGDGGGSSTTDRRVDYAVSESGGGGDIIADNTDVNATQQVTVSSFSLTSS